MTFDEDNAIAFIRRAIPTEIDGFDDDQILNIIDIIFDWQEENGLLDISADIDDEEEEIDIDNLTGYVIRMLHKDKGNLIPDNLVRPIVVAELDYENTLDPFDD